MNARDIRMQNALAAVTDAMLMGESVDVDTIVRRYNVPRQELEELMRVIGLSQQTLVEVQPSPHFARQLKQELIGKPKSGVWWGRMPVRVQLAALVAAVLGGMTFMFRRRGLVADTQTDNETEEAAVVQQ